MKSFYVERLIHSHSHVFATHNSLTRCYACGLPRWLRWL